MIYYSQLDWFGFGLKEKYMVILIAIILGIVYTSRYVFDTGARCSLVQTPHDFGQDK